MADPELSQQIRDATNGNCALGSARFQEQVEAALGGLAIRGKAGRPVRSLEESPGQGNLSF